MKILLWIISALAAFVFVSTGLPKVTASAAELTAMHEGIPVVLLKIAAVAEILGGLGITNIAIDEYATIPISLAYLLAAAGILWARSTRYKIAPRRKTAARPATS